VSTSTLDTVSETQQEELAKLRSGRRRATVYILIGFVLLIVISFSLSSVPNTLKGREGLESSRRELLRLGGDSIENLSNSQRGYAVWLAAHGLEIERRLFTHASYLTFWSLSQSARGGDSGFFNNLVIALHAAVIRIAFVIIACWRLWVAGALLAILWAFRGWKPYSGRDILGQMGTAQFFYSGLKADLSRVSETGAPERQVTGLACPKLSSEAEGDTSALGVLLKRWGVANGTNRGLTRVIVAHQEWPAYVAGTDGEALFRKYFSGANLLEHTAIVVERLLQLHREYQEGSFEARSIERQFAGSDVAEDKVSSAEYAWLLQLSCNRVLSDTFKQALGTLSPQMIATLVLSHFAGKVMAYGFQGGRWNRRSNFPELCARAVLHSIPDFGEEYTFEDRAAIRRALIYGSRKNIFAPVRFPVNLDDATRAMRSWVELMLSLPHELQVTADEVEFIGVLHEMHEQWNEHFFAHDQSMSRELARGAYATQSNLFIVPTENLVVMARRIFSEEMLRRAEELAALVSHSQRLEAMAAEGGSADPSEKGAMHQQGRVFPPLTVAESRELAERHGIAADSIKVWSALRAMLNHYGWLARRVGDYSVPEHSLIFAVVRTDGSIAGANGLGLIGGPGMIALRGTRLVQRWGKQWQARFTQGISATMAEQREDFDKLMRGIEDVLKDDLDTLPPLGLGNH
jgi:hypothetical protein